MDEQLRQEIIARKKAEAALEKSQEALCLLIENLTDLVYTFDLNERFTFVSPSVESMLGYTVKEVLSLQPKDVLTPESYRYQKDALQRAITESTDFSQVSETLELEAVRKDGSTMWGEIHARLLLSDDGQPKGVLGICRDITDRKRADEALRESEERFRAIFDTIEEGVILIDPDGQIVQANPAAVHILGLSRTEIESRNYICPEWEILRPDGTPMPPEEMAGPRAMQEKRPIRNVIMGAKRPDGRISWLNVSAIPLMDKTRAVHRVVGSFLDITEIHQMQQELVRMERLGALEEMSQGISHNLNNLLTGILGPAEMIQMQSSDADILGNVDMILHSALRAKNLVSRLHLSTWNAEEGERFPVDVNEAVREAIQMARPHWKDQSELAGATINIVTDLRDSPLIKGSQAGLLDILLNLLFNAVDAMPKGGTITVRTQAVREKVHITVNDTGIGMDEETRRRVFEPFFTTKMNVGSGLGLSAVFARVVRWGGHIEVQSEPDEGATFSVQFPVLRRQEEHEQHEDVAPPSSRARILVVDDDPVIIATLFSFLSKEHGVETFLRAKDALKRFGPGRYDVVLVDLGMPEMPGDQLCREMRRLDPAVAIVLITGWMLPEDDKRLSVFDFQLRKPFNAMHELQDVILRAKALSDARARENC